MYDGRAINPHIRNLGESPTFAINGICNRLAADGKKIFKLGLGQSPFPVPRHVVRSLAHHASERLYLPVKGLPELCQAVARFHNASDDLELDADHIMIGPGSKELLFLLQLVFNGEIIIPTPSWVSYAPQAKIIGHKIRFVHTTFKHRWHIQPSQITRLVEKSAKPKRPRLLILNSPGNPDGLAYSSSELEALAVVCREHKIIVLSDEIYGHMHHTDNHVSIGRYFREGTIISSGLSKWCAAGGWRLGTIAFPAQLDWLMKPMVAVASETFSSVCSPVQYAAVDAFHMNDETRDYLFSVRKILSTLGYACANILREAGVNVHEPEAGFYLFPDFSRAIKKKRWRTNTSEQMAHKLLEDTGVAVIPGRAFNRRPSELSARIAYINFDGATALDATTTIADETPLTDSFLQEYCGDTLEAMKRIAQWLQ